MKQDHVYQPYEDLLPYPSFSVRLSRADLPRIAEILAGIPDSEILAMQHHLRHVHKAFDWEQSTGGLAYNYTLTSIR
jgi:hypothetical protein